MTWTYDLSTITSSAKDQVRFFIGDTNVDEPLLEDEAIGFALAYGNGSVIAAAVACLQSLAAAYSRKADTVTGELRTTYSSIATAYAARAQEYQTQIDGIAFALPYAGGISVIDKRDRELDTDRTSPSFQRNLNDNTNQPVGPVGDDTSLTGG